MCSQLSVLQETCKSYHLRDEGMSSTVRPGQRKEGGGGISHMLGHYWFYPNKCAPHLPTPHTHFAELHQVSS